MYAKRSSVSSIVLLVLLGSAEPSRAETTACGAINSVPAVISTPGIYCLTHSLVTSAASGYIIDVQANNVVIDLNGYRLAGLAAGPGTTAIGIHADHRQNITIRNGIIRGFYYGIMLEGDSPPFSQGHLIEDIRADQNTRMGIVVIGGLGNIVRRNQVVATGGTTVPAGDGPPYAIGIAVLGDGNRVVDNDVMTVIRGNEQAAIGITIAEGSDGFAGNNRISQADNGVMFSNATGKFRDNLTSSVTTPYTGGTDAGNNH
jgi:hypothetical protein